MFKIAARDFRRINGDGDDPGDLCLHGRAVAEIGGETFEYDCTVSATGLFLLRTLTEDRHTGADPGGCQMLPCCGRFCGPDDETLGSVTLMGCCNGIDWSVTREGGRIKIVTESGKETRVDLETYREEVCKFADSIEAYYNQCSPKTFCDELDEQGYTAFRNEWHRRRDANQ